MNNNPINLVDPMGLWPRWVESTWSGIATGANAVGNGIVVGANGVASGFQWVRGELNEATAKDLNLLHQACSDVQEQIAQIQNPTMRSILGTSFGAAEGVIATAASAPAGLLDATDAVTKLNGYGLYGVATGDSRFSDAQITDMYNGVKNSIGNTVNAVVSPNSSDQERGEAIGQIAAVIGMSKSAGGPKKGAGANAAESSAVGGVVRTNSQLVQEIGTRAEAWAARKGLRGTPPQLGTWEHGYAQRLLHRYQRMFGDRGLVTEESYLNGVWKPYGTPGSVRFDVLDINAGAIWDYKFGVSGLTPARRLQLMTHGPNVTSVTEVRP